MPSFHRGRRTEESHGCGSVCDRELLQTLESCSRKTLELKQRRESRQAKEACFHGPVTRRWETETTNLVS